MSTTDKQLRVGMVGYAFMGAAHSQAWRTVNRVYDLPARARMALICGRDTGKVADAADRLGWEAYTTDWRDLISRDDIDVVDVCTPGDSHAEIALAALAAGKHVLCEKPLANTVAEARAMAAAAATAQAAGVRSMCGFNYRRVPAVTMMRQLVAEGRLGVIRHVRATYLQDWIVDPQFPLVWRLQRDRAGSGALGDIGAHIIDLTQFVTGQLITGVSAVTETFVKERPLPAGSSGLAATVDGAGSADGNGSAPATGPVTVDDAAVFVARLGGGALATYEATRFATGRKNALRVEINGSLGSVVFDLERLNELEFYDATRPTTEQGFTRILVTEGDHPYMSAWWPPGHIIGYEHSFTHQMRDFIEAVATGADPAPSFADALQVQLVLEAVTRSADLGSSWTEVEPALATVAA
ncbi:gfo/Idh/MocA family oxidoreductase [Micromonospora endolithica]|uniref:Gfo/Idh/MocA family oxidoreductase n=2 Tax=Micromonospora endolithica TaxID=230091 RepID=A0A3A9ZS93_9ACTN|nr:Gfo/Idh/MocA family oxidoreductase [Micromonospora endolithica]RKN51089.1 gfo/Idh/MocA family oxidoreductase [Micromonospora endolithica]TWJ20102.1 putative dehydrogenase [Micromonospora endolithica]